MKTRASHTRKNTIKKYIYFLEDLQNEMSNNKITSLTNILIKNNVSNDWSPFLRKNNIVFINNLGFYEWNKNVPISFKLVQTYRLYKNKKNLNYKLKRQETQPKLQFDMKSIKIPEEIKTMRTKQNNMSTQEKYYNFLIDLKNEMETKNKKTLNVINYCFEHNVTTLFISFLKNNNVIFKNTNGYYNWNEKIPVSSALVSKFRNYVREKNKQRTLKQVNYLSNIKVVKDEPKLIKQRTKVYNTGKEETKVIYSVQKQEIGLIRKFLKWIY